MVRHNWSLDEIRDMYDLPFPELMYRAMTLHRENFPKYEVQRSTLLSVKTGGCPEDCAYCPQSAHHETGIERHKVLPESVVLEKAMEAKNQGSTRFCMGAAWREVRDGEDFEEILNLVRKVSHLGLEVCCTLGMLTSDQANRLFQAGCHAYNHNLDTSPEFYGNIISTRTYEDRLNTLRNVRRAGMTICCGGIVGMGEGVDDRLELLRQLAEQDPHPESVPINMLVRVEGTPLAGETPVHPLDFVRLVATTRIVLPTSFVRLSAGRMEMSDETQALAFLAGANSIFAGEKLLTTPNPEENEDRLLLQRLGMTFLECREKSHPSNEHAS